MDLRRTLRRPLTRRTAMTAAALGLLGAGYALGRLQPRDTREWEDLKGEPLKVYTSRDDTANRQRVLLIDQWNAMHPDHPAELVELSPIADLTYSTVNSRLQSEVPDIDVVELDVPWIAEFAAAGYIRRLEHSDATGFIGKPYNAGKVDDEVYALPFHSDVGMLYYRRESVTDEQAAALNDWAGIRALLDEVLAGGAYEAGIAMQLNAYEGFTVNVWEYLLANGVEAAPNGAIDFGEDSTAVDHLRDLSADLHPELSDDPGQPPKILPASLQYDEDASLEAFQAGRTPLLRHWPRALHQLQTCEPGFDVGVVPMPGAVLGGQSLAISAFSGRATVAQALIEFLTGPASQQLLFERGGFAATRPEPYFDAIARLDNLREGNDGELPADLLCGDAAAPVVRLEAEQLHTALENAGRRPAVDRYTRYSRAFQDYLHAKYENPARPDLSGLGQALENASEGR